jgi:hypothetical protein
MQSEGLGFFQILLACKGSDYSTILNFRFFLIESNREKYLSLVMTI